MRIIALVLLLTACSPEGAEPPTERLAYAGEGRDRLCIAGERFGFILFGDGDVNCSARGRIKRTGDRLAMVPDGDPDCSIEATQAGDQLRFGARSDAGAYYCGPGADFTGRTLTKSESEMPVVDFAGDPLC